MEYVVVRCSDGAEQPVYIDDQQSGRTGEVLGVERGTHTFALCACADAEHGAECGVPSYRPVSFTTKVERTQFIRPLEVTFVPV